MRKIYSLLTLVVMFVANLTAFAQEEDRPMYIIFPHPEHIKDVKYNKESLPISANMVIQTNWMKSLRLEITPETGCTIDSWNFQKEGYDANPGKYSKNVLTISILSDYTNGVLTVYTSKLGEEKEMQNVKFELNDGAMEAITAVRANGTLINSWEWDSPTGFEVEKDANMEIELNTTDFHIDLFQVNGADTNDRKFTVTGDMTVKIDAHRYGKHAVKINGDRQFFTLYLGEYNQYTGTWNHNNPAYIDGTICYVDEKMPYLYIKRNAGYKLAGVTDENGEEVPVGDYFRVHNNMELNFVGEELAYDQDLVVFVFNADLAENPEIVSNDGKTYELTEGYQTLKFAAEDNIMSLHIKNADGKEQVNTVYLNDESVQGNSFMYNFNYMNVKHNDVILAFVNNEPVQHTVNVGGVGEAPFAVLRHNVAETADPSEFSMYDGTEFSIVPTSEKQILVKFGSAEAEAEALATRAEGDLVADQNGAYHFTVNGPISLVVSDQVPSAVNEIAVSGNAPEAIYNLQGIRVTGAMENLPAGIYVIDGKKVQIR